MDGSGTINPADLNALCKSNSLHHLARRVISTNASLLVVVAAVVASWSSLAASHGTEQALFTGAHADSSCHHPASLPHSTANSPRGTKRARTPDDQQEGRIGEAGDSEDKPRKRGRPIKGNDKGETPSASHQTLPTSSAQTPQSTALGLPQESPVQPSPAKSTPATKNVKALPTVRDHTTDQLNPEGDEYIPREIDEAGERKVTATGHLTDGRAYRCRTFFVPNRGSKLFMLATECARVLNYRDSYLLFNKNRSLFKIIASQPEKDDLIHQEILPYAYRSRQIAIVTARSMYRQFGARMIVNGRRVRDDYWESKARKQGFTEDDLAGEKRPGVQKGKDPPPVELTSTGATALNTLQRGEIIYRNSATGQPEGPMAMHGGHITLGPAYPMMGMSAEDLRPRDYSNVQRPRQDISGVPYEDRTQPSANSEIINQAATAAQYNSGMRQQRNIRQGYINDAWRREHKIESPTTITQASGGAEEQRAGSQPAAPAYQSPQLRPNPTMATPSQPPPILTQQQTQMMNPQQQAYARAAQQNALTSPIQAMPQSVSQAQLHQRTPNYTYAAGTPGGAPAPLYGYQTAMWPPPPPSSQASPIQQQQHHMAPYGHHPSQQQQPRQQPSPHPQQSPHHSTATSSIPLPYSSMASLPQSQTQQPGASMYGNMRGGYNVQPSAGVGAGSPQQQQQHQQQQQQQNPQQQQQYMQTSAGQQAGMQAWMPPGSQGWSGHGF